MFDEDLNCFGETPQEQRHFTPIKPFKFASLRFGGGGGDTSIDDTQDQKELARIALERWQRYQETYVPAENRFISEVTNYSTPQRMEQVGGMGNVAVQQSYTSGFENQTRGMLESGVNPSSGQFASAVGDYANAFQMASSDNVNRSQQGVQDAQVAGLQSAVAMGQGASASAMEGLTAAAGYSAQAAETRARSAFNDRQALGYGIGTAVGGAIGYNTYG